MRGAFAARGVRFVCAALAAVWCAGSAHAIEFADGRVEIHGFYEQTVRSFWEDFGEDDWDLAQWYHVLNLEIEADIAPDGFGPFDLVQAFSRIEVRYDCVWTRGCGMIRSADVYGNRPGKHPDRLSDGHRSGFTGNQFTGDTRRFHVRFEDLGFANRFKEEDSRMPVGIPFVDGLGGFVSGTGVGPDGVQGTPDNPGDDPGLNVFRAFIDDDCLFGHRRTEGSSNGGGNQVLPVTPACNIRPIGSLRDIPNPFSSMDRNFAVLGGATGFGALPFRPAPDFRAADQGPRAPRGEAQGVFIPNMRLAEMLEDGEFDAFDQNFRVEELAWNRGASQQDEKELKELYFDLEMFDSRLWIRVGKQNIVWGKTELFRTTDQFNPQDLALANLPSLEESRIALWAIRAVWSFWEVGPLSDVRLEVAANYDQFEPADLGRCGEPFSPLPVCSKTFGLFAHGLTGIGLAGEVRPPNPWNSWKGIEVGARLEWRWDRFSFAISDFYGYNDFPFSDRVFQFSRNVDPYTGRPREGMSQGRCRTGTEDACLEPDEALRKHSANQQIFAMICAASVAVTDLDQTACAQNIFGSTQLTGPPGAFTPAVVTAFNSLLSGQSLGGATLANLAMFTPTTIAALSTFPNTLPSAGGRTPLVPLNADVNDGGAVPVAQFNARFGGSGIVFLGAGLQPFLTTQQEALLGCGPFYGTQCDLDGIDLLNAEASVFFQSWPVFEGTFGTFWDTTDGSRAQPGTVGYEGGPVATRVVDGEVVILPGARGPGDPGYDPAVDGTVGGAVHPFTGQAWSNELAILSWNALMTSVGLSTGDIGDDTVFDPNRPFARDRCSFSNVQFCSFVQGLIQLTSVGRPTMRAGGNGRFGRRDFLWSAGGSLALRYEKRNVLGFSMDWAEDVTKSNWSMEFTWIEGLPFANQDSLDYNTRADTFNLTVSVDRPTFINFLNANRTFFFNAQFFFQHVDGYEEGFTSNGPWNFLATFSVSTGYFQDRMLPSFTVVYDKRSNSGAFLPQVTYRFTENFSATFGAAAFFGRWEKRDLELHPVGTSSTRVGKHRGSTFVENGLAAVRSSDELFLRLRYTF